MQFFRFRPFAAVRLPRVNDIRHFSKPSCNGETSTYKLSTFQPAAAVGKNSKQNILNETTRTGRGLHLEREIFVKPEYKIRWTSEMDAQLKKLRTKKKADWASVAEQIGGGVTVDQCKGRWFMYLKHLQQEGIKQGEWSAEEFQLLKELLPQHVIKPHLSEQLEVMTQKRINWTGIGKKLNRIPNECRNKWHNSQASWMRKQKKGLFTAEEDALIRQRVLEWGDKGNGLWVSLEKEMGRPAETILTRWESVLSTDRYYVKDKGQKHKPLLRKKAPTKLQWTPKLDAQLTEAVGLYKESEGWARVAEHMGGGITWHQCKDRWNKYLQYVQQEGIKQGEWSDEEKKLLLELVPQHVIKPYWSEQLEVMTQEYIDWTAIGKLLNRIPAVCSAKWNNVQTRKMKKGPFTAEEDALIRQRALEWGDKGNKSWLWVSLRKEMGRSAKDIRNRWRSVLSPISNAKDE